ncbi:hypothetical protein [Halorubellus sp. PRR65]|uniref:hypothetical protein n=1 Tax=Halorubellus sp. PRR65 TaxID=3098148 RepID=UPI002B26359E|nr:hypothetical protein [Halorubellus sp. PRR65]
MNVEATEDDDQVTVLAERDDVSVLATVDRDVSQTPLLEALSLADAELQHGLATPMEDARLHARQHATDGGRA